MARQPYADRATPGVHASAVVEEGAFIAADVSVGPLAYIAAHARIESGAVIGNHCFLSSHVVVSGYVTIGENCFLGVNSTIADVLTIGRDTIIGAGAVVLRDVAERQVMRGNPAKPSGVDSFRVFKVRGEG